MYVDVTFLVLISTIVLTLIFAFYYKWRNKKRQQIEEWQRIEEEIEIRIHRMDALGGDTTKDEEQFLTEILYEIKFLIYQLDRKELSSEPYRYALKELTPPKPSLRVSAAHPKLLSKRFTSSFVIQLYLPTYTNTARRNIATLFPDLQPIIHEYKSELNLGQTVRVKLSSPEITFSEPANKSLTSKVSIVSFLGRPNDNCHPGIHYTTLSISDPESGKEYHSMNFPIRVVDYVFDHVSRPLLSNVTSIVLAIGSLVMFVLTLLGKIDATLGVASGTTAGVLSSSLYYYFLATYQRRNVNIP